jgi:hypothetical protein
MNYWVFSNGVMVRELKRMEYLINKEKYYQLIRKISLFYPSPLA